MRCGISSSTPKRRFLSSSESAKLPSNHSTWGVALDRQHVGGDAIQEDAIMRDDDGAAGIVGQRVFL